jgi:hypothetical protein
MPPASSVLYLIYLIQASCAHAAAAAASVAVAGWVELAITN